jgi:hypothetical protein
VLAFDKAYLLSLTALSYMFVAVVVSRTKRQHSVCHIYHMVHKLSSL